MEKDSPHLCASAPHGREAPTHGGRRALAQAPLGGGDVLAAGEAALGDRTHPHAAVHPPPPLAPPRALPGFRRNEMSPIRSPKTPPRPKAISGPKEGSSVMPTITSCPPVTNS